jgi:hypothetical protein
MITLSVLCIIWGIVSYFRIKKLCNQMNVEFNSFEGSFLDCVGFIIGLSTLILSIVTLSTHYLP